MSADEFDDATLMAYADGTLEADVAQRVADAAEGDTEVAARIRMFRETGAVLRALGAARSEESLSDDLAARIERTLADAHDAATVVPLPARRRSWMPVALAASVALVVGVVGGIVATLALRTTEPGALGIAMLDEPALVAALDSLPAGANEEVGGGEVEIVASFISGEGTFCREFELDEADGGRIVSVACREAEGWVQRFAVRLPGEDDASYAPASSLAALDAYLSAIGAGPPLLVDEEATRLGEGD